MQPEQEAVGHFPDAQALLEEMFWPWAESRISLTQVLEHFMWWKPDYRADFICELWKFIRGYGKKVRLVDVCLLCDSVFVLSQRVSSWESPFTWNCCYTDAKRRAFRLQ